MRKTTILFLLIVLFSGLAIFGLVFSKLSGNAEIAIVEAKSKFISDGSHYSLVDEDGNVLVSGIKYHGNFCNGTTNITNDNGEDAIINSDGKELVKYGEYMRISQYSDWGGNYYCFYKATIDNPYQKVILKYDGEILYKDNNDKYLDTVSLNIYSLNNKYAVLETDDKYYLVNFLGDTFETFTKSESKLKVISNTYEVSKDYLTLYIDNKTYIYNLKNFKLFFGPIDGEFSISAFNNRFKETFGIGSFEKTIIHETMLIKGNDSSNSEVYYLFDGKLKYKKEDCKLATLDNRNLKCWVKGGYIYYDENGKEVKGDN